MAILVAAGGAALGTAIGVGPAAGWLAGTTLGNLLCPSQGPESRLEGPRLGDLTVTSSAYGAPTRTCARRRTVSFYRHRPTAACPEASAGARHRTGGGSSLPARFAATAGGSRASD
jgi:hypothetical protein